MFAPSVDDHQALTAWHARTHSTLLPTRSVGLTAVSGAAYRIIQHAEETVLRNRYYHPNVSSVRSSVLATQF